MYEQPRTPDFNVCLLRTCPGLQNQNMGLFYARASTPMSIPWLVVYMPGSSKSKYGTFYARASTPMSIPCTTLKSAVSLETSVTTHGTFLWKHRKGFHKGCRGKGINRHTAASHWLSFPKKGLGLRKGIPFWRPTTLPRKPMRNCHAMDEGMSRDLMDSGVQKKVILYRIPMKAPL